jgi:hypothetical protein
VVPANQSFEADNSIAGKIELGLILDFELPERQCPAQIYFHGPPGLHAMVHFGLIQAVAAAAFRLGAI